MIRPCLPGRMSEESGYIYPGELCLVVVVIVTGKKKMRLGVIWFEGGERRERRGTRATIHFEDAMIGSGSYANVWNYSLDQTPYGT